MPTTRFCRARTAALSALLAGGLALGAGALPASARTYPVSVSIQTHWTGHYGDVRSFRMGVAGSPYTRCISMTLFPGALYHEWRDFTTRLPPHTRYTIKSFSGDYCDTGTAFAGSRGDIDTGASDRWTIYSSRPPKLTN